MLSGEVERCTWAQSDGLLREQRPSQFDVLLTAVSVQQTPAFLLSFARHAVVLVCWVGFLIGNSVFTISIWVSWCDSCVFGVSKRDSGVSKSDSSVSRADSVGCLQRGALVGPGFCSGERWNVGLSFDNAHSR